MRNTIIPVLLICSALMAQGGHGSGGSSSSLQIIVNPSQTNASPGLATLVQSDNNMPYVNGTDGVCATMGSGATVLTLELDCSTGSTPRYLKFTGTAYPGPALAGPGDGATYGCSASPNPPPPTAPYTNKILVGVGTAFQSMTPGGAGYPATITIATQSTTLTGTSAYRLHYDTSAEFPKDTVYSSRALVFVTGQKNGQNVQWTIESAPTSVLPQGNSAMLVQEIDGKHSQQITECGFYQVPFSFTLLAQ